jgi:hypothetical protein
MLGVITIGLALTIVPDWFVWVGVGLLVVGALVTWWSGGLADIHGQGHGGPGAELDDVSSGDSYVGTLPTDQNTGREVRKDAWRSTAAADAAMQSGLGSGMDPTRLARAASAGVLLSGAWLAVTLATFAMEPSNHGPALRQAGAGLVVILVGVHLLTSRATRAGAGVAAVVSALFLLSLAVWWPDRTWAGVVGLVGGGVGLVAACVAAASVQVAGGRRAP